MRLMGIAALYRQRSTSKRNPQHQVFWYLLRNLRIERPNHVWAADITYIPMRQGFPYLFAVLDWTTRRVLAWRLSNSLTPDFCIDAVQEAVENYGVPEIFNTDQGSQFTDQAFVKLIRDEHHVALSMDGKGCWRDKVFVERFWKSLKYEEVFLRAYESVSEAKASLARYINFYNERRPHSALDARTPWRGILQRSRRSGGIDGRAITYRPRFAVQKNEATSCALTNVSRYRIIEFESSWGYG